MIMTLQQVGRTYIGRQHAFFDQTVCIIACARQYLFDLPRSVANDVRLSRFEIDGAANMTCLQ